MKLTAIKCQSYTVWEKLRIIKFGGQNGNHAAECQFGVSESIVRLWWRSKENLQKMPCLKRANRGKMCGWSWRLISWQRLLRRETRDFLFFHPLCDWKPWNLPMMRNITFLRDTFKARNHWCQGFLKRSDSGTTTPPTIMRRKSSDFIGPSLITVRSTTSLWTSSWTWMKCHLYSICHQTEHEPNKLQRNVITDISEAKFFFVWNIALW